MVLFMTDGVIVGVSCLEYLVSNLDACEEGPLDERKCLWANVVNEIQP